MSKPKIIVIVGPTASGKTSMGIKLAKEINGEIISADSMQIYKHMNIGTAKVSLEEMQGIPHHLIDIISPTDNYSVSLWKKDAEEKISSILKSGKVPIIVGGTGLFVSSLLQGYTFYDTKEDIKRRDNYYKLAEENGNEYLYDILTQRDPLLAETIDKNKIKLVVRTLEILDNGKDPKQASKEGSQYDYLLFGLDIERDLLYSRINQRVDQMISEGLISEIKNLIENYGLTKNHQSAGAIGYKEVFDYLEGYQPLDKTVELIKQHSRNYAKRQLTWFKRMDNLIWIKYDKTDEIIKKSKEFLREGQ